MLESRAIERVAWRSARATKIALHDAHRADEPHGQYFKEQVRRELVDRFGWQRAYQGGLRVFTTIDMPMQLAAEAAIAGQIRAVEEKRTAWQARRTAARKKAGTAQSAASSEPSDLLQAALIAM